MSEVMIVSAGCHSYPLNAEPEASTSYGVWLEVDKVVLDAHTKVHRVAFNQAFKVCQKSFSGLLLRSHLRILVFTCELLIWSSMISCLKT